MFANINVPIIIGAHLRLLKDSCFMIDCRINDSKCQIQADGNENKLILIKLKINP